jgi:esterase/lipase superfamily enzyme
MMPPPYLYAQDCREPFENLHVELQVGHLDVLFATDRRAEVGKRGELAYGSRRSRSLTFGSATVAIGDETDWSDLLAYSRRAPDALSRPRLSVSAVEEIVRFPETPYASTWAGVDPVLAAETLAERSRAIELARRALLERLDRTERKEINLHVHGVNTSFEQAILSGAETWHFFGREGVPIVYTWPTRKRAAALSYGYDRESGEFTIFHLKQLLKALAEIPEVDKINILAHSRGPDVVLSALRELFIEARAAGKGHVEGLRIGKVALLAADLDLEVATQRVVAEAMGLAAERITLYVYESDYALAAARTLFGSRSRVGNLNLRDLDEGEQAILQHAVNTDVVVYDGRSGGKFGHFYFRDNPAVSSDLLLWMRYGLLPGAENGRPLRRYADHVWLLNDDYLAELTRHRESPACQKTLP